MENIKDFVIVDTETTGYSPSFGGRVIEVAAIRVRNLEEVEIYSSLVRSVDYIPLNIVAICGITAEMLNEHGQDPEKSFYDVRQFIGDDVFVGHNVNFDLGFLNAEFSRYELRRLDNQSVCTLSTIRRALPKLYNHKLETVKRHMGMDVKSHRALNDTYVCLEIMKRFNKFARLQKTYSYYSN